MRGGAGRIILHVGAPKTGSTYIQRRLRADPEGLRRQGVHVPVLPAVVQMAGNAKLLATVLSEEPSLSFIRAFPNIDVSQMDPAQIVADLLRDWRSDREDVVLSAENFRPSHAARLRRLLPPDVETVVVLFVRRQDRWIESYHNQLVKTGDTRLDPRSFVDLIMDPPTDRLCCPDWWINYEAWWQAFGQCRIVFFEEARADLLGGFFAAAETPHPLTVPDIPPQQESLDLHQYAYLMTAEPSLPHTDFLKRRAASAAASLQLEAPAKRRLLYTDLDRLTARFSASNNRLLEALGRSADDKALRLLDDGAPPVTLGEVLGSDAYRRHRELADALYAGEGAEAAAPAS